MQVCGVRALSEVLIRSIKKQSPQSQQQEIFIKSIRIKVVL